MKAFQYTRGAKALELKDLPIPDPEPGRVLVKIEAAGLCHSDCTIVNGHGDGWICKSPITLGHETAGTIIKLGAGVTNVQVSDRVTIGTNEPVINGFQNACGLGYDGGYGQYTSPSTESCVRIPANVGFAQAAVATDSIATAYHAVVTEAQVKAGTTVAILGLGGLGLNGVVIAALQGATVYGVDIDQAKFGDAVRHGARACFRSTAELAAAVATTPIDIIVDFVGVTPTVNGALKIVKTRGRVVLVGLGAHKVEISTNALVARSIELRGSIGSDIQELRAVLDLIAAGKIVPKLEEIPFEDVPEGLRRLDRGEVHGRLWTRPNA